jgi:L-2-hydroxyglutarate oxidase
MKYDFIIIGAGIVGLSTAWQLKKRLGQADVLLLEKEDIPAYHQTGHNSGVIHAGVYYEPGSFKARFCKAGARATYEFCEEFGVPCERTGKLLVATDETELKRMQSLFERCQKNGLDPILLQGGELQELEPSIIGKGAFLVRDTGIVDFTAICSEMLRQFHALGGAAQLGLEVTGIVEQPDEIVIRTTSESFRSKRLVVCGGLMADRLARLQGLDIDFQIIPYRGEYYRLRTGPDYLVKHLVYPVPDPDLPFLGVHLTRMIDGSVTVGPNAVQGWKREGYGRFNFNWRDTAEMLSFPGFWKTTARHLGHGLHETLNSIWKQGYLAEVRKYCPQIKAGDLEPYPAGIRAQAVLRDGTMVHDFLIKKTPRSLHVCNAPSPAATSAIPIGQYLCSEVLRDWQ